MHQSQSEIESGGVLEDNSFRFDGSNVKLMLILSDGTYSDKILAPIRELSCNAWDAHIEAGTEYKPFDVTLPNVLEPTFKVRDYGPGLCHEHVMKLYTTYGKSTKDESNDFIGGFGIGSKSPFAYSDAFTVISWHGGIKRVYAATFDRIVPPKISLLHEEKSSEHTGLEVSFPVKSSDFNHVKDKVKNALQYFPIKPVVKGDKYFEWPITEVLQSGKDWWIPKQSYSRDAKVIFVQGNVAYPCMSSVLLPFFDVNERHLRDFVSSRMVIKFPIGALDVAASREELSYDERTVANIKSRIEEVYNELVLKISKEFANCSTLWEAMTIRSNIVSKYGLRKPLPVDLSFSKLWPDFDPYSDPPKVPNVSFTGHCAWDAKNYKNLKYRRNQYITFQIGDKIYWDDMSRGAMSRIVQDYKAKDCSGSILVIHTEDKAVFEQVWKVMGEFPYTVASTLPKVPSIKYRGTLKQYKATYYRNSVWNETTHTPSDGGVFVNTFNSDVESPKSTATNRKLIDVREFKNFWTKARDLTLTPVDMKLYGVAASAKNILENDKKDWTNLFDYVITRACSVIAEERKNTKAKGSTTNSSYDRVWHDYYNALDDLVSCEESDFHLLLRRSGLQNVKVPKDIQYFVNAYTYIYIQNNKNHNPTSLEEKIREFIILHYGEAGINIIDKKFTTKATDVLVKVKEFDEKTEKERLQKIRDKYPLLFYLDHSFMYLNTDEKNKIISGYTNMVNERKI
jgi:hypothetical protein